MLEYFKALWLTIKFRFYLWWYNMDDSDKATRDEFIYDE